MIGIIRVSRYPKSLNIRTSQYPNMNIVDFNPWWETGSIDRDVSKLKKRYLFDTLKKHSKRRQIDAIIGLRRVGKTTLMYHLIEYLLEEGVEPKNIFYFSFDVEKKDVERVIGEYEEKILKDKIKNKRVFLFFDEIQKLEDWENKIKVIYDLNLKAKIFLSGSASLNLMKRSMESLAGRVKFHYLSPLTFKEFLEFSDEKIPNIEDFNIHKKRLNILLNRFLMRGFPETLRMDEKEVKEYIRDMIVERVIYRDIPESFRIDDIEIVKILVDYIFENPGTILNVDALSKDLGRHKKTIRNALNYLELSFLIKRVGNLRGSFLAMSRKNKKAYPLHSCLSTSENESKIAESLIRSEIDGNYYWRKGNYEVDFVMKDGSKVVPLEVKYKEKIRDKDLKPLKEFMKIYSVKRGYLVSKEKERQVVLNGKKIILLPLTKFLLFKEKELKR